MGRHGRGQGQGHGHGHGHGHGYEKVAAAVQAVQWPDGRRDGGLDFGDLGTHEVLWYIILQGRGRGVCCQLVSSKSVGVC